MICPGLEDTAARHYEQLELGDSGCYLFKSVLVRRLNIIKLFRMLEEAAGKLTEWF